jgi:XTP/dITP diphosphohydrolase
MNQKITLVSYNRHKFKEYEPLFKSLPLTLEPLDSSFRGFLAEDHLSFEENAIQKVNAIPYTGTLLFSEDSGLLIEALDGAPGVFSKRFSLTASDYDNNKTVLSLLKEVSNRSAKFVAVIALKVSDHEIKLFKGECLGSIHTEMAGENGFGYDPIFIPLGYSKTFAELGPSIKQKISHRHHASKQLISFLKEAL